MGAGALEAPTTKLRRYPVFDPRTLTASEKTKLIKLAQAVWEAEAPVNWEADGPSPGPKLRALDAWLLDRTKTGIELDQLYTDLKAACQSRITVAKDTKNKKKHRTESITSVADGIAAAIAPALNIRQFPESFCNGTEKTLAVHVDRSLLRLIRIESLMNMADVTISGEGGRELFKGHYPLPVRGPRESCRCRCCRLR